MEEILRLILDELKSLKEGQARIEKNLILSIVKSQSLLSFEPEWKRLSNP